MATFCTTMKSNKKPWTVDEDEQLLGLLQGKGSTWKWLKCHFLNIFSFS